MSGTTVGGCEVRAHRGIRRRVCEGRGWIRLSAERLEDVMPCQLTSGKM